MAGPHRPHKLKTRYKFAYGIGHLQNDLTAALWFSFLLTYFVEVIGLSTAESGVLMLLGQVVDALATPVVGKLSDKTVSAWGKRRPWHLGGAVAVGISFPLMIAGCVPCSLLEHFNVDLSSTAFTAVKMTYYGLAVTVFQLGWASNQVAHLAMCPELTKNELERTQLNSLRYAVTVVSMMTVYAATWVILGPSASNRHGNKFDERDERRFVKLSLAIVSVGAVATAIFHREMAAAAREEQQRLTLPRSSRRGSYGGLGAGGEGRVRISEARVTVIEGLPPPLSPRACPPALGSTSPRTAYSPTTIAYRNAIGLYRTSSGETPRGVLPEAQGALHSGGQLVPETAGAEQFGALSPSPAGRSDVLNGGGGGGEYPAGAAAASAGGSGVDASAAGGAPALALPPPMLSAAARAPAGLAGSSSGHALAEGAYAEIAPAPSEDGGSLLSERPASGGLQRAGGLYRTATYMNDDIAALVSAKVMGIGYWLRQSEFYVVATVYMCTRLVVNTSQVYMPLFLLKSLHMPMDSIAQVPLLMCVSSLAATVAVNRLTSTFGVTAVAVVSVGISAVTCFSWLHVASDPAASAYFTIVAIVLVLGWSSSIAMVSSLTMAASLTGRSNVCGALLYGIFSFTDKLSSGVVIMVVEELDPCTRKARSRGGANEDLCDGPEREVFFRHVVSFVPGCAALAALLALLVHVLALGSGWAAREAAAAAALRRAEQEQAAALREPLLAHAEEDPQEVERAQAEEGGAAAAVEAL